MNPYSSIPAVDPAPLPGPAWLFQALLLLTFFLHLLPMNFLVGGGFQALLFRLRPPRDEGRGAGIPGSPAPGSRTVISEPGSWRLPPALYSRQVLLNPPVNTRCVHSLFCCPPRCGCASDALAGP